MKEETKTGFVRSWLDENEEMPWESEGKKQLRDGIYSVSENCEFLHVNYGLYELTKNEEIVEKVYDFVKKHPNCYIGSAYETFNTILLSEKPEKLNKDCFVGSGFNYGSTNLFTNAPKRLLILSEND
jgi:hypothetical protein